MTSTRIHHTGYTVSDLDRSVAFYRDLLGCEVIAEQEKQGGYLAAIVGYPDAHVRMAHLRVPGSEHVVELFQYLSPDERRRVASLFHHRRPGGRLRAAPRRRSVVREPAGRGGHRNQPRRLRSLPS